MANPPAYSAGYGGELAPDSLTVEGGPAHRRRHAAGEDPAKRDQILDGARQVFLERGYDAASMNDICRAAGVSKGTIYVYFTSKEELFVALIEEERDRISMQGDLLLEGDLPLEAKLRTFARRLAEVICSDDVIRAQRIIVGTAERMPELGARFYDSGARRVQGGLQRLFEREVSAGRLAIPDIPLAAYQFMELASAGLWRQRLFGKMQGPPSSVAAEATADAAVAMFLGAYGRDPR